jgi:hypothetical protein
MTVAELIAILQTMPQDLPVEINDNEGGEILQIDSVDHFGWHDLEPGSGDQPVVMIQANC